MKINAPLNDNGLDTFDKIFLGTILVLLLLVAITRLAGIHEPEEKVTMTQIGQGVWFATVNE